MLIFLLTLGVVLLLSGGVGFAQGVKPPTRQPYFSVETGHWVSEDFLKTYLSVPNPQQIFGEPITEPFFSSTCDRIVQYFEKARFELVADSEQALHVRITLLGEHLYMPGLALPIPDNFPACRFYPETGYQVCYAFADFFTAKGGVSILGYPISNFEMHDDFIVQYFQRARLEWHPEFPPGERVTLGDLGREYFQLMNEDARLLRPPEVNNLPLPITSLKVRAFAKHSVMPISGRQTLYILVQNQNFQPVPDAEAVVVVKLPSGNRLQQIVPTASDKNGVIEFSLSYADEIPGEAQIEVIVSYLPVPDAITVTSFRIWY